MGLSLQKNIKSLYDHGIDYLNISLDTFQPQRFIAITGKNLFQQTLHSIQFAEKMTL